MHVICMSCIFPAYLSFEQALQQQDRVHSSMLASSCGFCQGMATPGRSPGRPAACRPPRPTEPPPTPPRRLCLRLSRRLLRRRRPSLSSNCSSRSSCSRSSSRFLISQPLFQAARVPLLIVLCCGCCIHICPILLIHCRNCPHLFHELACCWQTEGTKIIYLWDVQRRKRTMQAKEAVLASNACCSLV